MAPGVGEGDRRLFAIENHPYSYNLQPAYICSESYLCRRAVVSLVACEAVQTGRLVQWIRRHSVADQATQEGGTSKKPNLKRTAVPSQHLPLRSVDQLEPSPKKRKRLACKERAEKRAALWKDQYADTEVSNNQKAADDTSTAEHNTDNTEAGIDLAWVDNAHMMDLPPGDRKKLTEIGIQVDSDLSSFVGSILHSHKKLKMATGLHSLKLLTSLTICADEIAPENAHRKFNLSTTDRIVLTMMKIKLSISFSALSVLFDLKVQTCSNYFYDTVSILSKVLNCMVFWPDKEEVLKNMPKCFSGYKCTRVVSDCFETPVGKPKCIACRVRTYSQYKKNHTAKISMNIAPSGLITLCSKAFGGRASDKIITENTGIYTKCDPTDGVMVDKGYHIDNECDEHMLVLIRPPFLRKTKKFSRAEAVQCAKIARARVHVERVIQRVRTFHILKNKIPWNIVPFIDDLFIIVAALVNLGKPVLARDKF